MDTLIKLTNPEFQIEFADRVFTVRKASLDQVVRYMKKVEEIKANGLPAVENGMTMIVHCLWLVLSKIDPTITEEFVYEHLPGNVDAAELMVQLGFLNPKRAGIGQNLEKPTSDNSSPSSPTEPDGGQPKSENSL